MAIDGVADPPLEAAHRARTFSDEVDHLIPLLKSEGTVAVAYGLVGLGQSGTEGALSEALMRYGDRELAIFHLISGNSDLRSAALDWALENGYESAPPSGIPSKGGPPSGWGDLETDVN